MLCLLALFSALLCSSLAQEPDLLARFGNTSQFSTSPLYELYWNVTGNRISFAVHVETEGWVGFGISPNGLMLDSDVIMGFVDDTTGVVTFTDRRTDTNTRQEPDIDAQQDWNLDAGRQSGGFTTLEFSRLLDTGDTAGDRVIEESLNLIWSFRTDDETNMPHTTRGAQRSVNLLPPQVVPPTGTAVPTSNTTTSPTNTTTTPPPATTTPPPATTTLPPDTTTPPSDATPTPTTNVTTMPTSTSPTPCTLSCDPPRMLNEDDCVCECPPPVQPCPFGLDELCFCRCPPGSQEQCVNNETRAAGNERVFNLFTCNCTCFPRLCGPDEEFNSDLEICRCVSLPPCPEVTNTTCPPGQEFSRRTCTCRDICDITCDSPQEVDFDTCTCRCPLSPIPLSEKCPPPQRFSNTTCFCECPPDLVQECPPNQVYNNFTCSCECDNPPTCPSMFILDTDTCACICDTSFSCPEGQSLDTSTCKCICDSIGTCPPGQIFNDSTCKCDCDISTQQPCCEGHVFDPDSCSCVCKNVQKCSAGYVFDSDSCQCVCEGSISEDIWYDRFRECWRDNYKVFNIFACGCECPRFLQCSGKSIIDPNTCRCVCPKLTCPSPKVMNPYTCDCQCSHYQWCRHGYRWDREECRCKCQERSCPHGLKFNNATCSCESMCPRSNTRCHSGFTFDYNTCQCKCSRTWRCSRYYTFDSNTCRCKCSRTCKDNEVLDPWYCQCRRKQVTHPPTRSYIPSPTTRDTRPPTTRPPHTSSVCPRLRSAFLCSRSRHFYGVSCRWSGGRCCPVCCQSKGTRQRRTSSFYCSWLPESYCIRSSYCSWKC